MSGVQPMAASGSHPSFVRGRGMGRQPMPPAIEARRAAIRGGPFFRAEFSGISAILGCYAASGCHSHRGDGILPVQVAYNPLARSPLGHGQLGAGAEERTADLLSEDDEGMEWSVRRIG